MIPSRQLAARPGKVWAQLKAEGALVITKDGAPCSIMLPTSGATLVEDVQELVFARARKAVSAVRAEAARLGLDRMSADEIDAEIAAARRARKGKRHG